VWCLSAFLIFVSPYVEIPLLSVTHGQCYARSTVTNTLEIALFVIVNFKWYLGVRVSFLLLLCWDRFPWYGGSESNWLMDWCFIVSVELRRGQEDEHEAPMQVPRSVGAVGSQGRRGVGDDRARLEGAPTSPGYSDCGRRFQRTDRRLSASHYLRHLSQTLQVEHRKWRWKTTHRTRQGRNGSRGLEGPDPLRIRRRGRSMFWPPKMSHSFIQNCCCITVQVFISWRRKELVSIMGGKTSFSRRLKQFDGLIWLTPTAPPLILRQIYMYVVAGLTPFDLSYGWPSAWHSWVTWPVVKF